MLTLWILGAATVGYFAGIASLTFLNWGWPYLFYALGYQDGRKHRPMMMEPEPPPPTQHWPILGSQRFRTMDGLIDKDLEGNPRQVQ